MTDSSTFPRQMHYACPFCMSKIDIVTQNMKVVGVKATEYPMVFDSPAKCANYSGTLIRPSNDGLLSDECLTCPKILQCNIRRH